MINAETSVNIDRIGIMVLLLEIPAFRVATLYKQLPYAKPTAKTFVLLGYFA